MAQADLATLVALETALHLPEVRRNAVALGQLLHDDFLEFGRSGRSYRKAEIVALLLNEPPSQPPQVTDFALKPLAPGVALLTYRSQRQPPDGSAALFSLRSSVWQWQDARWQLVFHQGTPTQA